jgi:copper chaperone NosL
MRILPVFIVLLLAGWLLSSCSSAPDFSQPPEIRYGEDTCERCYMIINEARYAAAYVTSDGESRLFDDIGGMIAHFEDTGEEVTVFWVHDVETEAWLRADQAYFVKSDHLTPMGYGIVALAGESRAKSWAADQEAVVVSFSTLLSEAAAVDKIEAHQNQ